MLIGVIGSFSSLGFFIGYNPLINLGRSTGISPLAVPFVHMGNGRESMNFSFTFFVLENGIFQHSKELESFFFGLVNRPHRMAIPFESILAYSAKIPKNKRENFLKYFCDKRWIKIRLVVDYTKGEKVVTEINCK